MRLWLTLVDSDTPTSVDLLVQAPPRSQVGDLRPHLPGRPARAEDRPDLYVGCSRLPDDAELGRPPLLDGAVIHVGRPASVSQVPTGLLHLEVTSGPDAGGSYALTTGSHVVGRSPAAEVRIEDPDLSRAHLTIEVQADSTQVTDLGTTNGSRLDDVPLFGGAGSWPSRAACARAAAPWSCGPTDFPRPQRHSTAPATSRSTVDRAMYRRDRTSSCASLRARSSGTWTLAPAGHAHSVGCGRPDGLVATLAGVPALRLDESGHDAGQLRQRSPWRAPRRPPPPGPLAGRDDHGRGRARQPP